MAGRAPRPPPRRASLGSEHGSDFDQLFSTEPITAMTLPDTATLEDKTRVQERWRSEWNQPLQVPSRDLAELPQPAWRRIQAPRRRGFATPPDRVRFERTKLQEDARIEYSASREDCRWVDAYNQALQRSYTRTCPAGSVLLDAALEYGQFEAVIDRLEKDSYYYLNSTKRVPEMRKRRRTGTTSSANSSATSSATSFDVKYQPLRAADPMVSSSTNQSMNYPDSPKELRDAVLPFVVSARTRVAEHIVCSIIDYWLTLRGDRQFRPLLQRFAEPLARDVFRQRRIPKKTQCEVAAQMRYKYEKLRMLTDLVRRREEAKRDIIQNKQDLFERRQRQAKAAKKGKAGRAKDTARGNGHPHPSGPEHANGHANGGAPPDDDDDDADDAVVGDGQSAGGAGGRANGGKASSRAAAAQGSTKAAGGAQRPRSRSLMGMMLGTLGTFASDIVPSLVGQH